MARLRAALLIGSIVSLAATASAQQAAPKAPAAPGAPAAPTAPAAPAAPPRARVVDARPMKSVSVALFPEDTRVAVDGQLREHPPGVLELRGPLGAVFTIEAMAGGVRIVERVAITDVGALPAQLAIPPPQALAAPPVGIPTDCSTPFWYDEHNVKRYKPQCIGFLAESFSTEDAAPRIPYPIPPSPPPFEATPRAGDHGFLSLAAYPWVQVSEGSKVICTTPCVKVNLPAGAHTLLLENSEQGLRHTIVVHIRSGETTAKAIGLR